MIPVRIMTIFAYPGRTPEHVADDALPDHAIRAGNAILVEVAGISRRFRIASITYDARGTAPGDRPRTVLHCEEVAA